MGQTRLFSRRGINRSIGTQFSATYQDLDSYFGNLPFTGKEQRLYGNLIFQDNLWDTRHTFKGGLDLNAFAIEQQLWNRDGSYSAMVAGAYGEYSFVTSPDGQGLSMILGQRVDGLYTGNDAKFFYVPRLHVKYNIGPGRCERKRADPTVLPHLEQNTWDIWQTVADSTLRT